MVSDADPAAGESLPTFKAGPDPGVASTGADWVGRLLTWPAADGLTAAAGEVPTVRRSERLLSEATPAEAEGPPRVVDLVVLRLDDCEDAESEPLEPAEPVRSANAIGIEAMDDPTPRATANAPTRPTYFA